MKYFPPEIINMILSYVIESKTNKIIKEEILIYKTAKHIGRDPVGEYPIVERGINISNWYFFKQR